MSFHNTRSTHALTIAVTAITIAGCAAPVETAAQETTAAPSTPVQMISPAQWLQRQPKPIFKPGHTMPRLTRFGWDLSYETQKVLAEDWNYVLQTNYLSDATVARLQDPTSREAKMAALTLSDPKKYPFGVILDRSEPPNPAAETFLRDAEGKLIAGNTYSPLNPQSTLDQMAELRARPLRELRKKVPINIILNGGEYGLGVLGFMQKHAEKDPKVMAAKGDQEWFDFLSKAKAQERNTIATAVREAVPDRQLYIYYNSGNVERNRFGGWKDWGYDDTYTIGKNSDLPSNEYYYKHFNSGYLPDAGGNDILTRALNATGFQLAHGQKNFYDWLSSGWVYEADDHGDPLPPKAPVPGENIASLPQLQEGNAAALVDPNAGQLSPMDLYTGFLKCLFTGGMLGGNAGYYAFPIGGFDASFPAQKVPHWIPQMTALSQVQALFSYLEDDLREGDLLPGPQMHRWSREQPAYEFPTNETNVRVLARKMTDKKRWLITVWASDGVDRPVKVSIPGLGEITLLARAAGNVYTAMLQDDQPQLIWLDADAMTPTAKGFAPQAVTEAQILASFKAPVAPQMEKLLVWFDAAKGVEKDEKNAVLSWKSQGELADLSVTSSLEGKLPLTRIAARPCGLPMRATACPRCVSVERRRV